MNSNFHDFDVSLFRDSLSRPWGFRLQGGADFNFPLTVQRVFSGSPSESRLLRGDIILALDNYDVGRLTHKQAQDVVRVAGAGLTIRVRRPGAKSLHSMAASPPTRRPHSTTPRNDPTTAYFAANQPPKPTWQPPASQNTSSSIGNFGVQYGPKKTTPAQQRPVAARTYSPQIKPQSPYEEEEALKRVEDSLHKLTMNHNMANEEDQEVDYSFTKKSVSERRKLFQDNPPQNEARLRSTSCQPTFRANLGSHYSPPSPQMTSSYTEPSWTAPTPFRSTTSANVMSSSYTEGTKGKASPSWRKPTGGFNFGWSPSPEKLAAARVAPHVSSVSQLQHSVVRSRESSREASPQRDSWMGAPLLRSTSVSVLHESPTRATIRYQENASPWDNSQFCKLGRGQLREVGRWSMSSHFSQAPSTPSWTVHQPSSAPWSQPSASASGKKFSTSATIRVGQSGVQQPPVRTVRRFSTSSTPLDGTMSLDRRHHEPLKISIGSVYQPDYHPAYPANVYQQPVERSWSKPAQHTPQRSVSQRAPARQTVKSEVGTYRPLQQSFSTPSRPQSAMDPDYMSSDF